jgi:hypothetical protein
MADRSDWRALVEELDRWSEAGRTARLWLRDDDAIEPGKALDRLLGLADRYELPVTLAVIPANVSPALAPIVASRPSVAVAVHGWDHRNHAGAGEKKAELGAHRRPDVVLGELGRARSLVEGLFGKSAVPVLVPPWNRIADALLPELEGLGFRALSTFGRARGAPPVCVNTHVDPIDWHGDRTCLPRARLIAGMVAGLRDRRIEGSAEPLGVLTHHLVHDEAAWSFLDDLFAVTTGHEACRWSDLRELLD